VEFQRVHTSRTTFFPEMPDELHKSLNHSERRGDRWI
jgi:hypothetical protein